MPVRNINEYVQRSLIEVAATKLVSLHYRY